MEIEKVLGDEIQSGFESLKDQNLNPEQYKCKVEGLSTLVDKAIEIEKLKSETVLKEKQLKDEKRDRLVKNILTATGVLVPAGLAVWGTLASFKFEETGSVTTIMGRGFVNSLLYRK